MGLTVAQGQTLRDVYLFQGVHHLLLQRLPDDPPRGLLGRPPAGELRQVPGVPGHRLPGDDRRGGFRYLEVQENMRYMRDMPD